MSDDDKKRVMNTDKFVATNQIAYKNSGDAKVLMQWWDYKGVGSFKGEWRDVPVFDEDEMKSEKPAPDIRYVLVSYLNRTTAVPEVKDVVVKINYGSEDARDRVMHYKSIGMHNVWCSILGINQQTHHIIRVNLLNGFINTVD